MRASLSQKNNAVQPIPAPTQLIQVLFTLTGLLMITAYRWSGLELN